MKNKSVLITLAAVVLTLLILFGLLQMLSFAMRPSFQLDTVAVQPIQSQISAAGTIHSENEATLHFQTGGKVTYLPYKIGDNVYQGATIAQLDTYALQRQLTSALNTYRSTRDTFDQTQSNAQSGVLQNGQKSSLNIYNQNYLGGDQQTNAINDAAKRIVDQNQANLDNSVISVELANYALQLSTLTSPINGVVTSEDITTSNVNVTPLTSFSVADPTTPVFKAHVDESDIDYVSVGASVQIQLNGLNQKLSGVVEKIEPQKISDTSGNYYIVDIASDGLKKYGKLGQSGNVLIANTSSGQHLLIPTWAILGHNYVWVLDSNTPVLKQITIGQTHGNNTEVLHGLSSDEKVITNPQAVAKIKYSLL